MAQANLHHDDFRRGEEHYPETYGNDRQHQREYYPDGRGGYASANYPQFGAAEDRHWQGNDDYYGSRHQHRGPPRGESEFRQGGSLRFSPQRPGGYDEARQGRFGPPGAERHPRGAGPHGQDGEGHYWRPEIGSHDDYAYFGTPGHGQAYPEQSVQFHGGSHVGGGRHDGYGLAFSGDAGEGLYGAHRGWGQGTPGGSGDYPGHARHPDPDYHQWRQEQIRNLDRDYNDWRQERYHKFSSDFDSWRSNRPRGDLPQTGETDGSTGAQHSGSAASQSATSLKSGTKS